MDTPPDPRHHALTSAAASLRRAILAHAVVGGLLLLLSIIAALLRAPEILPLVQRSLLVGYSATPDAAALLLLLLSLANISVLLILYLALQAHEVWALPALLLFLVASIILLVMFGYLPALISLGFGAYVGLYALRARHLLRANPVMIRELRGRMRGARAFVVLTLYLALMGGFSLILYFVFGAVNAQNASSATGVIGRTLFVGVVAVQLLLIILIAPSFTAGAITGERERQTYDLVRTTLLTTPSFIIGKLESSLAYILLLLLAAIPLQALAFLFGGIGQAELLLAFVILMVTAVAFGAVGIFFSASQVRTLSASVRTYSGIAVGAFIVPFVPLVIINLVLNSGVFSGSSALNTPVFEALLHYIRLLATSLNPFTTALDTQNLLVGQQVWSVYSLTLASDGSAIPMVASWIPFSILYMGMAALLVILTIRAAHRNDREA